MVLAFCNSLHGPLSVYQVSLNHLQYFFLRYATDKLFLAKIKKGSNSVYTGDRVMVLAFCNSPRGPLSEYQVSLNYLQYFLEICSGQNCDRWTHGRTDKAATTMYMLSLWEA